jgi:methanogenic corrinoid protein MtbC1
MAHKYNSKEPRYNLSFVIQETGIKADTLRAWERRYQLPQPQRTEGGHRLFSEYDIQTIKWLMARQKESMSISRAVRLWRDIESQGQDPLSPTFTDSTRVPKTPRTQSGMESLTNIRNAWIQACLNYDESTADGLLTQAFAQFPLETVCVEILQAGLSMIGMLWYQGEASVQQEHFASELANRRIHALIAGAPNPFRNKTILVGCPLGENHTFSALLTTLFLRYRSWKVVYLGANVPKEQLIETIEATRPDLVVMVAMRLTTSAALLNTTLMLGKIDIPVAFGGWIFEHVPGLSNRIPGYYLGRDILEAISNIENLLTGSMPKVEFDSGRDDFDATISHFIEKKHLIEIETLDSIKERFGVEIPLTNIQEANEYLAQDMIAALTLGDLSLIQSNVEWVENLISNHDVPGDLLFNYLLAYYEASQTNLDEPGDPIIEWLASIIQSKA